jgi:sigma-B regulation protein RsbU (phosphoserine phosphatase)
MAVTQTLLKTNVLPGVPLSEVLGRVNDYLSDGNDSLMFVTLFAGLLDVRTGEVDICDGGHNPPVMIDCNGKALMLEKCTGVALGIQPGFVFQSQKVALQPGDGIFLYTDGVTEAMNEARHVFSDARLVSKLNDIGRRPVEEMLPAVMAAVTDYAGAAPQSDDIAMLGIRFTGVQAAPKDVERTRTPRVSRNLAIVEQQVADEAALLQRRGG